MFLLFLILSLKKAGKSVSLAKVTHTHTYKHDINKTKEKKETNVPTSVKKILS